MHFARGSLRPRLGPSPRLVAVAAVLGLAGSAVAGCTANITAEKVSCRQFNTEPDTLREASLQLAGSNIDKKVRYETLIMRICAHSPESAHPVAIIHKRYKGL